MHFKHPSILSRFCLTVIVVISTNKAILLCAYDIDVTKLILNKTWIVLWIKCLYRTVIWGFWIQIVSYGLDYFQFVIFAYVVFLAARKWPYKLNQACHQCKAIQTIVRLIKPLFDWSKQDWFWSATKYSFSGENWRKFETAVAASFVYLTNELERTEGYSKSKVRKNNDKFGKRIGLNK